MEEDSRVLSELRGSSSRGSAGIISKIRLENFMCHSSLLIEFGDWVNFITGQNGSGKSAILTALCIAFGSRARTTQRASSLKEFIKTGCSYAVVIIELKNQGEDAFKPDIYGDLIIIERRITETTSSMVLKDRQGKKVAHQKEELRELVEHFNIDVENPCVIMGQDKSREFLHSGNDKEKFKFFFRATLLQQVDELLENIRGQLDSANAIIDDLESSIRPILKELDDLQEKIKNLEHVEEISQKLQKLKKKLAWAWVYDVDKQIQEQAARVEKLKDRIPTCQARIDRELVKVENLKVTLLDKKAKIASMMERTSEVRKMKDELQQNLSQATREKLELEEELTQRTNHVKKLVKKVRWLEQQVHDIQEQHVRNTQAEVSEMELRLKSLEVEVEDAYSTVQRLKEEENALHEEHLRLTDAIKDIGQEIEEYKSKHRDINGHIRSLQQQRTNKVTAFGGDRVLNLLRSIERHHMKFRKPPIGPIGAHMALVKDDGWALAIEHAIGKLLNSFIVTDHKDSLLLRQCAREANYQDLRIIIYDYSRPLLNIPPHMLPNTNHPTIISVIHADIPTIINVLVDQGDAERLVLVRDYEMGKNVAFEQRISNLKEVYTKEGYRMFSRGSVQTTLPPNKRIRSGRLCGSIDDQITVLENDASEAQRVARHGEGRKREVESALQDFQARLHSVKRRRLDAESYRLSKELELRDLNSSYAAETSSDPAPDVDELLHEISTLQDEKQGKELLLEKFRARLIEAGEKATAFKQSFENLCVSAKGEIDALEEAERELLSIQEDLRSAETEKAHYEGVMQHKVLSDIKQVESEYEKLQLNRAESYRKASIICSESEVEALGGCVGSTPEYLSAKIKGLNKRLQYESQRYPESIDDLRIMHERKKHKISRKQQTYEAFREKMNALQKSLDLRRKKFQRNAILLKRQLTWQFDGHLRKKGISGLIKVDYEKKTLSVEVKMPQDASSNSVRDTRGLSGGERSFSTLCFALALHEMTEAPFRAMDEFDVFMDAVSRKISLDTLVDFAVAQGSQWIFITPHDISMVKPTERVRKQQMAAPRS